MVLTIIIFVFTLLVLVLIHEFGHFLMAKKFNIKVEEFGIGIPPKAWGKKVGETLISVNWLPFGGFVRLMGEDETDKKVLANPRSFASQTISKRIAVVVAGVVMNLILAWILFYIVLAAQNFKVQLPMLLPHQFIGATQTNESVVLVQAVSKDSPADLVGLKSGDQILKVNGEEIKSSTELISITQQSLGKEIKLTVSDIKGENIRQVNLTPRKDPPAGEGAIGVGLAQFQVANLSYETPMQKLLSGPIHSLNVVIYSGKIIGVLAGESLKTGKIEPVSQTVAGPVGITNVVNSILTETKDPLIPYLDFVAMLSLNLAVFNVLPIPALDGGRLFFLMFEGITRKKVKAEVERYIHAVGLAILLGLMLLITLSDIRKLLP
jgi:regulator of sigma E protease